MKHSSQLDQKYVFFGQENKICHQHSDGSIYQSTFGNQKNVSIRAVLFTEELKEEKLNKFVFGSQTKYYKYCHKK